MAIVDLFKAYGATVIIADIDEELARSRVTDERTSALFLDQGDPASIERAFAIVAQGGGLDVLVNCAGIYPRAPLETVDTEFLDRMWDVNLRGVLLCTREAVKQMKPKGGAIVNISSIGASRVCIHDAISYGVTKAGVNGLTSLVGLEYAQYGIRVNAIMPGGIDTETAVATNPDRPIRGPFAEPGRVPLCGGQLGKPEDIAAAALYFASDASRYVTGQILAVDGGFLIS
ncbi:MULTISPECIES: SDR family NAD(P)-dependent oxidoreductase [Sphingobium]|uniref:SDR family NAD(P)-dependent oxidoreductase n=1 Tax=Sphingobium sp. MI1205 TaxID=407020 RepID=UPI002FF840B9